MSGSFTIQLTYPDYLASSWLRVRRRWSWTAIARYVSIVGGVIFLINFGTDLVSGQASWLSAGLNLGIALLVGSLALAVSWLYLLWCIPRSAKKIYAEQPLIAAPTTYAFTAEGIRIHNERESSDLLWSHIQNWMENDSLLLMARTRLTYFPIPKAQLRPETLAALQQALMDAGVPKR